MQKPPKQCKINARHISNDSSRILVLLAIEDITDFASLNNVLTSKNDELQSYNEQLQAFSEAASYDMLEPLSKIHMFCKKVCDTEKNLSDVSKHALDRVLFSVSMMRNLINDLIRIY